jgi:predicted membrane-bound spermidine synthase
MHMNSRKDDAILLPLTVLFTVSGIAGLVYQIAWQRVLFAAFGSDIESVSLVVAAFMMGLGLGALAGGWVADRLPGKEILLFALCEAGIGLYGLASVPLLRAAGDAFVQSSRGTMALVNFLLVLPPTALMGGTLPILIAGVARRWGHVGKATGHLYSANTLGAAAGAFMAASMLFSLLDIPNAVRGAAVLNLLVAGLVIDRLRRAR